MENGHLELLPFGELNSELTDSYRYCLQVLELQASSFNNDESADVEIHVGDKVFRINSYFLILHSSPLAVDLSNPAEGNKRKIVIQEFKPEIIEAMLRFMLSGKVENLEQICHELYVVADRYEVKLLKSICLDYIFEHLNTEVIFKCLELAFQIDLEHLKQKAINFAIQHRDVIQQSHEWEPLIGRYPQIGVTFMRCLTKEADLLKRRNKELEDSQREHRQPNFIMAEKSESKRQGTSKIENCLTSYRVYQNRFNNDLAEMEARVARLSHELIKTRAESRQFSPNRPHSSFLNRAKRFAINDLARPSEVQSSSSAPIPYSPDSLKSKRNMHEISSEEFRQLNVTPRRRPLPFYNEITVGEPPAQQARSEVQAKNAHISKVEAQADSNEPDVVVVKSDEDEDAVEIASFSLDKNSHHPSGRRIAARRCETRIRNQFKVDDMEAGPSQKRRSSTAKAKELAAKKQSQAVSGEANEPVAGPSNRDPTPKKSNAKNSKTTRGRPKKSNKENASKRSKVVEFDLTDDD